MHSKFLIILFAAILLCMAFILGYKNSKKTNDADLSINANYSNIAYAANSKSQVCDIYIPDTDKPNNGYPLIILVHGGGFAMGNQNSTLMQPVIKTALKKQYAVMSVDYRKSSEAIFPVALSDVKASVRWAKANSDKYGFDRNNITIWGESAGAYLADMTALTPNVSELNGDADENINYSSNVKNLVSFYAPVEFYTIDKEFEELGLSKCANHSQANSFESKFLGQALNQDKTKTYTTYWETYKNQLPKDFILKVWIQAGSNDENVPYIQSLNLSERLGKIIDNKNIHYNLINGAGHMDTKFYTDDNLNSIFDYLSY